MRRPPRSPLFPSPTLFRSRRRQRQLDCTGHLLECDFCSAVSAALLDRRSGPAANDEARVRVTREDRKSTRLNSSHANISYAVFCLKKKKTRPLYTLSTVFH